MKKIIESEKFHILVTTIAIFSLSLKYNISEIIIQALSFLILMEVIRTIYDYIMAPEHRVRVGYIIDGGILFGMRELFVGWIMIKTDVELSLIILTTSITLIGILIYYSIKVTSSSPEKQIGVPQREMKRDDYFST